MAATGLSSAELDAWPHADIRRMQLAESVAPWGESAQNIRALYIGAMLRWANGDKDTSPKAAEQAAELMDLLLGKPEPGPPQTLRQVLRSRSAKAKSRKS